MSKSTPPKFIDQTLGDDYQVASFIKIITLLFSHIGANFHPH